MAGVILIGRKRRLGFLACTGGNSCYAVQAYTQGNYSLLALSMFLIGLNLHAFWKWGTDGR